MFMFKNQVLTWNMNTGTQMFITVLISCARSWTISSIPDSFLEDWSSQSSVSPTAFLAAFTLLPSSPYTICNWFKWYKNWSLFNISHHHLGSWGYRKQSFPLYPHKLLHTLLWSCACPGVLSLSYDHGRWNYSQNTELPHCTHILLLKKIDTIIKFCNIK